MCGLKEIFEGAGNFCDKKVPCKSHFSIREKLNLIRFIKTLYKNLFPSSVTATLCHLLHRGEGFKTNIFTLNINSLLKTLTPNFQFATLPFSDGY